MTGNSWSRWIQRWLSRPRAPRRPPPRTVRPCLEWLEDRITPTTFTPTTFADDGTANSLRGVIMQANNDSGTATDTIQLAAGTYTLTIANTANKHDVSGTQGDLNITNTTHALVIQGVTDASGKPTTFIDQTVADRVFQIVNAGTTVTFKDVIIEGGVAQDDGGAGTVAGSTVAEGGGILDAGGNVTLSNVVVQSNQAQAGPAHDAEGGGLYALNGSLTITNSVIQKNKASGGNGTSASPDGIGAAGGGIYFFTSVAAQLSITGSTVAGNQAVGGNGYSSSNGDGGSGVGGGIFAEIAAASSSPPALITASTVSGNEAIGGDGSGTRPGGEAQGGGIKSVESTIQFVNSTIAENNVSGGNGAGGQQLSIGGGVYFDQGTAIFTNVTVARNNANGGSETFGGGIGNNFATVTLANTLVALNNALNGPDYHSNVAVSSNSNHNLIGIAESGSGFSAAHGDLLGSTANPLNPVLGPLANNGGSTQTIALLPGSPALNAGDNTAQAVTGPNDQRGYPRVAEGIIDIGAFEYQPPPPPPSGGGGGGGSGGGGGTTATPPSLFQALLSLFIDGAALEATNLTYEFIYGDDLNLDNFYASPSQLAIVDANAAAAGINYDTVMSLERFLSTIRGYYTIQPDIAANVPYAGPFAEFAVLAGAQAALQAVQL